MKPYLIQWKHVDPEVELTKIPLQKTIINLVNPSTKDIVKAIIDNFPSDRYSVHDIHVESYAEIDPSVIIAGDVVEAIYFDEDEGKTVNGRAFVYDTCCDHKGCKLISDKGVDLGAYFPEDMSLVKKIYHSDVQYVFIGCLHLESDFETIIKPAFIKS